MPRCCYAQESSREPRQVVGVDLPNDSDAGDDFLQPKVVLSPARQQQQRADVYRSNGNFSALNLNSAIAFQQPPPGTADFMSPIELANANMLYILI